MPQLIKSNTIRVEGENGECRVHITLDLNITLKTDGSLEVQAKARPAEAPLAQASEDEVKTEETAWAIPTFTSGRKINFGKKEE